jgi:hypothetical protein
VVVVVSWNASKGFMYVGKNVLLPEGTTLMEKVRKQM